MTETISIKLNNIALRSQEISNLIKYIKDNKINIRKIDFSDEAYRDLTFAQLELIVTLKNILAEY